MGSLEGKRVLVVGGSSGIGLAAAQAIAQAGARVTIAARSAAKLEAAKAAIGQAVEARVLDAAADEPVAAFFAAERTWDHIVASTGGGGRGAIREMTMAQGLAAMNGKFWVYFRVARAAAIAPGGSLTLISGTLGHKPQPDAALVSGINAAINGLTRGLALDLAPVRVNAVSPGVIDTPLWNRMPESERRAFYERTAATLPARRLGQAQDVAHAILFLMTNPYATGLVLTLEGGGLLL